MSPLQAASTLPAKENAMNRHTRIAILTLNLGLGLACTGALSDLADTGAVERECGPAVPGAFVCHPDDSEYLWTADSCGNPIQPSTRCYNPKSCEENAEGQAECRCGYTGELTCASSDSSFANSLYDDTYVVRERTCVESSAGIDPVDIAETCGFGSVCFVDDYSDDGHAQRNGGEAFCAQSVTEDSSPYQDFGCDAVFSEFMRYPTALEVDCRCRIRSVSGSEEFAGSGAYLADPENTNPSLDASAHPAGAIANCAAPSRVDTYDWPVAYGSGPVFQDYNAGQSTWIGAEFDPETRELFSLIEWGNSTVDNGASIVAWNVDTADRRVVSGLLPNAVSGMESYGSGYESPTDFTTDAQGQTQPFTGAYSLRLASDGMLYVSSEHEVIRVDPEDGHRELVWRRQNEEFTGEITDTFGQCLRPSALGVRDSLQLEIQSFGVGPDLSFYKGISDVRGGTGVLHISADGSTCEVIARWNAKGDSGSGTGLDAPAPEDVGSGYLPSNLASAVQGMLVHAGDLYVVISGEVVAIDLNTLKRVRVDDDAVTREAGYTAMHWDPEREVIWTSGSSSAIFGNLVVDPISGQTEQIETDSGMKNYPGQEILRSVYPGGGSAASTGGGAVSTLNHTQMGGVVVDPENPDVVYGVTATGALLKLELSTFNNYIMSWGQH